MIYGNEAANYNTDTGLGVYIMPVVNKSLFRATVMWVHGCMSGFNTELCKSPWVL